MSASDKSQLSEPKLPLDSRGFRTGVEHAPWLRAGQGHQKSTGWDLPMRGRVMTFQSTIERNIALTLALTPTLVDYREQYPICDMERIVDLLDAGKPILKTDVPTLDAVATFSGYGDYDPERYLGISVKASGKLNDAATIKNLIRDKTFCEQHGWRWCVLTERDVVQTAAAAMEQVLSWANSFQPIRQDMLDLQDLLRMMPREKTLAATLDACATRMGVHRDLVCSAFAHSVLSQKIILDRSKKLALRAPLYYTVSDKEP